MIYDESEHKSLMDIWEEKFSSEKESRLYTPKPHVNTGKSKATMGITSDLIALMNYY